MKAIPLLPFVVSYLHCSDLMCMFKCSCWWGSLDPRVWIWRFGARCTTQCGVGYSHTQTCCFSFVCLFNWGFHFISGVVQNGHEILHWICMQFLSTYFFLPLSSAEILVVFIAKARSDNSPQVLLLLCLHLHPYSPGPHGELSMHVSWNSHSLLRHNLWQGGDLWVDLQLSHW